MSLPKEKAHWEDAEVDAFLDYLISQRSKLAGTNFKEATYSETALKIAGLKKSGPVKTASHCRVKWAGLKSTYNTIEKYRNRSGCHWDSDHGASIQGEAAESVWSEFVQSSSGKSMKSFKNTGWRFHSKMEQILPSNSIAHGSASYNPTSSAATGAQVPVPGPSVSNIAGDTAGPVPGPSTSNITHDASTSIPALMPPPSSISSLGKCQLDDMTSVAPSGSAISESVSQLAPSESDSKKLKLTGTSWHSSGNGRRKGKDAASVAAWMNLQGSINRLSDGLTTSMTVTEDSRVADETTHALDSMQAEEELTHDEKIILLNAFLLNARICTVYLNTTLELRIGFLRSIIVQVKHNIPFL
ncbi:hypothetical protein EV424DRAFT_1351628 [Suillus variegatus]|nr:hypothetical protein EV424DRAFT_1351628 [Suillus variegatus]